MTSKSPIVDVRGDKVRLGINAPTTIPVHRKEVYDAIKLENHQAATLRPDEIGNVSEVCDLRQRRCASDHAYAGQRARPV
jgi:carbon storage regulator